ncbi:helix-turn-helix domain-containing protein [Pseudomaricurvus alkylphenolicus]|uniref:GlxA family transcriptional regulator n=1 Tax=Pseudomaricurvus alkylphenolicus TaxID=1306991 RepID=UPI00141EF3D8|nr:helix-turn-helix domain-containing protein [Pseudomaricurvus alkylphenolicus]NIB44145.1 helix-turn-helix domain-containing protein [Pseudomaricurvus alkylphenolicus]
MVTVTILVFDYALSAAVMGINDLLYFAGNHYARLNSRREGALFNIRIASCDGQPIKIMNNLTLNPHCAISDIEASDVYLVPTITGGIEKTLQKNPWLIECLQKAADTDCLIGSNSNGSFFLAEAGLLENKQATTFWDDVNLFRERYPQIDLRPDQLLIHDGNILCDAGGTAWFDLGLYLVELFCDHQTAMDSAKYFLVDLERSTQFSYSPLSSKKYHGDHIVRDIQQWMEDHYNTNVRIDDLCEQFGLSNRSLVRRFKQATGITPLNYLQDVRLDSASRLLVQSNQTIEKITHEVGYEDISSFTRLFKRRTGFSPSGYRARFRAVHVPRN